MVVVCLIIFLDPRVSKIKIYIGQAPSYNPLKFGKKTKKVKVCVKKCVTKKLKKVKKCVTKKIKKIICEKKCKVGEGSVLTIKGNKIKVKKQIKD